MIRPHQTGGRVGKGAASPAQMNPANLPEGDTWRHACPHCPLVTQGGLAGLANHIMTMHPGEAIPDV